MIPENPTIRIARRWPLALCALLTGLPGVSFAQVSPAATPDKPTAQALAKYDKNKNGVLDADEQAAMRADEAKAASAVEGTTPAKKGDVVELSPFEVNADNDKGYYAQNTMSGTRISSKLEDLGSSISVVTKQQMQDFAMLDINDVFLYEANTEGTGNYTDVVVDRSGNVVDNVAGNPNNANRVRGLSAANQSFGNFETSGRVPFDPSSIDSLEISRGPNSSIFGLGNGSGTVNAIPASANLTREASSVELRTDDLGMIRSVLDINRPLLKGKLAVRGIAVYEEDEYVRQPSFSRTNRYTGMLTYKPFKNTTFRAIYEHYENYNRRPNAILPRDGISYWQQNGRPTWNAATWTVTRNGQQTVVPYQTSAPPENLQLNPLGLESIGTNLARSILFVDQGQIGLWMTGYISGIPATTTTTPNPQPTPDFHPNSGHQRFIQTMPPPRVGPLAPTAISITDQSVYDWTEDNIAAANWGQDKTDTATFELEQFLITTPRHLLAAKVGYRSEDSWRYSRSFIGTGGSAPMIIRMDITQILPDGRPNPYFLKPYTDALEPAASRSPQLRQTTQAQLAYKLSLAHERNWLRWIGDHTLSGYTEYKDNESAGYNFKDLVVDNHTWLAANANRNSLTVARPSVRYYLGDNQGDNIDYGSGAWDRASGTYNFRWYNAALGQWVDEPATFGEAFSGGSHSENIIKTFGAVTQNHLFSDRIVTTFGLRKDENFNRNFVNPALNPDGITLNLDSDDHSNNDWFRRDGRTKQSGVVVKPLRNWQWLDRRAEAGSGVMRWGAELLRSLNFSYNKSDSFRPETIAQNVVLKLLPNPTSLGTDKAISFSLFNKIYFKYGEYETTQQDSRTGDAGVISQRAGRLDFAFGGNNDQFNLQRQATAWLTDTVVGDPSLALPANAAALTAAIEKEMKIEPGLLAKMNAYPIADTSDQLSKGKEIEITLNPTSYWTARVNIAQQRAIETNVTPATQEYIDARIPVWQTIIDKRSGLPWYTTRYGSAGTASDFLALNVTAPYKLLRANEGKTKSQIREWRVNALTNIRLSGLFPENNILKRLSVSGAVRWEDKASIGYYAYDNDPNAYDPNRRIYDEARAYYDGGVSYSTKIYRGKVGMSLQLNVRNIFEGGRLQAVNALPNGVPYNYRIIDPRQFILTARFTL